MDSGVYEPSQSGQFYEKPLSFMLRRARHPGQQSLKGSKGVPASCYSIALPMLLGRRKTRRRDLSQIDGAAEIRTAVWAIVAEVAATSDFFHPIG
jgi:hypothetical protein